MKIVCSLNAQVLKCFAVWFTLVINLFFFFFFFFFFSPFGGGGVAEGAGKGRIAKKLGTN